MSGVFCFKTGDFSSGWQGWTSLSVGCRGVRSGRVCSDWGNLRLWVPC